MRPASPPSPPGLIFIGVQINHPQLNATSIPTTEWVVRDSLKVLMAVLALVGITGMYLSQIRKQRHPRAHRLPGVRRRLPHHHVRRLRRRLRAAEIAASSRLRQRRHRRANTGRGTVEGDIGALQAVLKVRGVAYLAGGLLFGIALYRARVLPLGGRSPAPSPVSSPSFSP